jgi:hypothetical protein
VRKVKCLHFSSLAGLASLERIDLSVPDLYTFHVLNRVGTHTGQGMNFADKRFHRIGSFFWSGMAFR